MSDPGGLYGGIWTEILYALVTGIVAYLALRVFFELFF